MSNKKKSHGLDITVSLGVNLRKIKNTPWTKEELGDVEKKRRKKLNIL